MLTFFYSIIKSKSIKDFFYSLITFPILHFSYGSGYLIGFLSFIILNKKPSKLQSRLTR